MLTMDKPVVRAKAREAARQALRERWLGPDADRRSYCGGLSMEWVRRAAADDWIWEQLEYNDLVKVELEPDHEWSWEDLEGDMYDVGAHEDTVPGGARAIKAQQKRFRESIEQDGVWTIVCYYRTSEEEEWSCGSACWGFDYEYANTDDAQADLKSECISELRKALKSRCPSCRKVA